MMDEGYIKFRCNWSNTGISIPYTLIHPMTDWRKKLYDLSLIGMYDNGIGFGNISIRKNNGTFFITGSATGGKSKLLADDYALVTQWKFKENLLDCIGKTKASSESLTHAAIYESFKNIGAVIHIHNEHMWNYYLQKLPATSEEIQYGTPEMALAIQNLLKENINRAHGIFVMGGHREGIISFGKNMDEAGNRILDYYYQSLNNSAISDPESK